MPVSTGNSRFHDLFTRKGLRTAFPQDEIQIGSRPGVNVFNQFGYRKDLQADVESVIWADDSQFIPTAVASPYTITYDNTTDGGGVPTGAFALQILYLDENLQKQTAIHILGTTGTDITTFSGFGINRCAVALSGSSNTNVNNITLTDGAGNTQAFIPATASVTQQCVLHNGISDVSVVYFLYVNCLRISSGGGGDPKVGIRSRVFNRTSNTNYVIVDAGIDAGVENNVVVPEIVGVAIGPGDIIYYTANTDTNGTNVSVRFSVNTYDLAVV